MSSLGNQKLDHLVTRDDFDPSINLTDAFVTRYNYVSSNGQTVFSGTDANGLVMALNVGAEVVYLDGVLLRPIVDYTVTLSSITLTSSLTAGHELAVIVNTSFNVANTYSKSEIDGKDALANKGFKNYIINGNFDIWQRDNSQTTSGYGSDDRWSNNNYGSTKTHSRVACTDTERALFNAPSFSRTVVSSVAKADNNVNKAQYIEDVTKLAGKTVTLSFWAKADSNKNIAIEFAQIFGTGGTPSSTLFSISPQLVALTTTWQKKTITVTLPSIVGKTIGTDGVHTSCTRITFWLEASSTLNSRTATLGQQSGTFDIAQVQLEEGSVATPFENRPYGLELSLCQRYYEITQVNNQFYGIAGLNWQCSVPFKVTKRVNPTVVVRMPTERTNIGTISTTSNSVIALIATGAVVANDVVNVQTAFGASAEL